MKKSYATLLLSTLLGATTLLGAENLLSKVTNSSGFPYGEKALLTHDKDMKTSWVSYTTENAKGHIQYDFAESVDFQAILLLGNSLYKGDVTVSNDNGNSWTTVGELKGDEYQLSFYSKDKITANMIKINLLGADKKQCIVVREASIYEVDDTENLALFAKVTETAKEGGLNWTLPAVYLVDGNKDTASKPYSMYKGSTLEFDLGEEKEVSSIQLNSFNHYKAMKLSVAGVDKKYTELKSTKTPEPTKGAIKITPQKVQYIKFEVEGMGYPLDLIVK